MTARERKKATQLSLRATDELVAQIDKTCRAIGLSRSEQIRCALILLHAHGDEVANALLRSLSQTDRGGSTTT